MVNDRTLAFVKALHDQTLADKVEWELAAPDPFGRARDAIATTFGRFTVEFSRTPDRENPQDPDFRVTIDDDTGVRIEDFTNYDLQASDRVADGLTVYKALKDIYAKARRIAVGSDKAMDEILDILRNPKGGA